MARNKGPRPATLREARLWLQEHDYTVGERGPIPKELLNEYTRKTGRPIGRVQTPETR
jgi:hypothetical protein